MKWLHQTQTVFVFFCFLKKVYCKIHTNCVCNNDNPRELFFILHKSYSFFNDVSVNLLFGIQKSEEMVRARRTLCKLAQAQLLHKLLLMCLRWQLHVLFYFNSSIFWLASRESEFIQSDTLVCLSVIHIPQHAKLSRSIYN